MKKNNFKSAKFTIKKLQEDISNPILVSLCEENNSKCTKFTITNLISASLYSRTLGLLTLPCT